MKPVFPAFAQHWRQAFAQPTTEWRVLRWLAPLVFLHSLIYVFLAPPWQHYDEPGHFLYAAYIVSSGIDAPDDVAIAREVADSMYRHQFWPPGVQPDLLSPHPPGIPTDQRHHPPLYYALMARVIGPLRYLPVEMQLYAGRLVSALLMMLTVVAVWRTAQTIVPDEPRMALVLAAMVTLTPAFVDLMSAFNSDVLMNFAAAAAFLGMAILVRDGWRPTGLALAVLGASVAILTKRTALPIIAPLGLALLWSVYRRPIRWWMYLLGGGIGASLFAVSSFSLTAEGLQTQPWLAAIERDYLRIPIVPWLVSWADWERAWPWYQRTIEIAHNHFWVRLAWGHIPVWPPVGDWFYAGLSLAAIIGLWRGTFSWPATLPLWQQRWLWLCLLAVIVAWLALFGRLHPLPLEGRPYIPRGRYLYWAMVPAIWLLALGWQHLWPERWRPYTPFILVSTFAVFDVAALIALITFYYQN
ncbi:glycosyltransferase family 39 protein [Chloroflexus sp.]|uniref:glycosyltransferase family 39 protein n=1 Tax=Chloroflexus sp. TaxID=1904827 RepID=UPI002ACE53AC|nr:glycosyltransferase family 39 protein [Chloroflexus sp.]